MWNVKPSHGGMKAFTLIWFGQLVSLLGTAMTRFALMIWAYDQTGNATTLAMLGFFAFASYIVVVPFAGVLVDRWDRRRVLMGADMGAGLMTILIFLLYATDSIQIWHLFLLEAATGAFEAFQIPAYNVAVSTLVPPKQYGRAAGMRSLAFHSAKVLGPAFAALMLEFTDIRAVMMVDVTTFLFALSTLLIVAIPKAPEERHADDTGDGFWSEMKVGFTYIVQRKGLFGLMLAFAGINAFAALTYLSIMPAMLLARSGGDELVLASVQSALGVGGVLGGLALSIWGGPRQKIHGVFAAAAVSYFMGDFLFAVGRSTPVWIVAAVTSAFFIPFIVGCDRAIWQAKVPPSMQGRVLSALAALRELPLALGFLVAGPLADKVFEPAMMPGGTLAETFGWLVGTGAGAGMGLMFVFTWIGGTLISLAGYLYPPTHYIEILLPDHDEVMTSTPDHEVEPLETLQPVLEGVV